MSKITDEIVAKHKASGITTYLLKVDTTKTATDTSEEDESEVIEQKEGVYYAILKKPGRKEIGHAMSKKDPLSMGESFLKMCWIDGDDEMTDINFQDTVGVVAALQAANLFEVVQGSLKKL
ncbi:hypothetical protein VB796_20980 [Arcicella sp. LKC2W]|uniref:hypothetical protein n=1 Tax=Arcicella sp. LKC2W TaxID=2984198 RepID=UPI002B2024B4|nr:hypothetical protein [Arcicella sp. LKC2W]MEA5461554.1 hypothetical protein [Arcicella sp. LKC2W]